MHNSDKQNTEFQLTFCQTNLAYLSGAENPDKEKIEFMQSEVKRLTKKLDKLNSEN